MASKVIVAYFKTKTNLVFNLNQVKKAAELTF